MSPAHGPAESGGGSGGRTRKDKSVPPRYRVPRHVIVVEKRRGYTKKGVVRDQSMAIYFPSSVVKALLSILVFIFDKFYSKRVRLVDGHGSHYRLVKPS